jgi:pyroglutamyl-peptidase
MTAAPSILLIGFEPFDGPVNASWEGVRGYEGRPWNDYTVATHCLPVVWGEILPQLERVLDDHRPVAALAFGQGTPDGFEVETQARNSRGAFPDNHSAFPKEPAIIAGGPDQFGASGDVSCYVESLRRKGYPVRASEDAGRYLCEECLYSLEYLRSTRHPDTDVLFCHVPPLGKTLRAKGNGNGNGNERQAPNGPPDGLPHALPGPDAVVTRDYIDGFVGELLTVWAGSRGPR